jgi:hypothetical protein
VKFVNKALSFYLLVVILIACEQKEIRDVSFKNDIQPIFSEHCSDCHYGEDIEGNIKLDNYVSVKNSKYFNRDAPMFVAGNPEQSRIYIVVSSNREAVRMPPSDLDYDKLGEEEIETIKVWIKEGAKNN